MDVSDSDMFEKSMSNVSNDAGPFGQGSGEDCPDGFTYDDMAPLTEGQDSKRKPNRFMNKKKVHEVDTMSKFVAELCENKGIETVS